MSLCPVEAIGLLVGADVRRLQLDWENGDSSPRLLRLKVGTGAAQGMISTEQP
jgi:hypothetical protein